MKDKKNIHSPVNRVERLFAEKKANGKTALILFLTAGYPDMKTTEALIPELEKSGADLIELGVPFSDPIADGPTIQKASSAALDSGCTLKKILALVKRLRKKTQIPIILFSAYNPFFKYGIKKLIEDSSEIGVDGFLIPDLPPTEADELISACDEKDLSHIFLVAPNTPPSRANEIMKRSTGFIYYISTCGVTGARDKLDSSIDSHLKKMRQKTKTPVCVGFGISRPEHVSALKENADGIIVGSALIKEISKGRDLEDRVRRAKRFTRRLSREL
jgi:tryptophan synthase alpha chain